MIKAVFCDIDGTLVSFKTHQVAQSTIDALAVLREKGVKVFVATGRHYQAINNLDGLTFDGYITLNGSYCLAGTSEVIYKHAIPQADVQSVISFIEEQEAFPCAFVHERESFINYIDDNTHQLFDLINYPKPPIAPLQQALEGDVFQMMAFFNAELESKVMPLIPGCQATRWNPISADITPAGGSKQVGIDKIIAHFGIDLSETMAFGDGGNDVSMLRHAAIGVAMGNANEDVKQSADYVTDTVDDDGIYKALKHFGVL